MIYNLSKTLLRVLIVGLILIPIVIPFLEKSIDIQPPAKLTVWVDSALPLSDADESRAIRELRKKLSLEGNVQISLRTWGSASQTPIEDYEELWHSSEAHQALK